MRNKGMSEPVTAGWKRLGRAKKEKRAERRGESSVRVEEGFDALKSMLQTPAARAHAQRVTEAGEQTVREVGEQRVREAGEGEGGGAEEEVEKATSLPSDRSPSRSRTADTTSPRSRTLCQFRLC